MPYCAYCGSAVNAISFAPCASCGSPTNGAPRSTVKGSSAAVVVTIVVVVLLVGVAFIGILSAIAIPNLLTAMQRSKQKRSMADMLTIARAVDAYAADNNKRFPDAISMDQLAQKLSPTYIQHLPTKDGWGNLFHYDCWSSSGSGPCDTYAIASGGKDGRLETEDLSKHPDTGATTNFDNDIVMRNGQFIEYPQGIATR